MSTAKNYLQFKSKTTELYQNNAEYSDGIAQDSLNGEICLLVNQTPRKTPRNFKDIAIGSDNCHNCEIRFLFGIQRMQCKFRLQAFGFVGTFIASYHHTYHHSQDFANTTFIRYSCYNVKIGVFLEGWHTRK